MKTPLTAVPTKIQYEQTTLLACRYLDDVVGELKRISRLNGGIEYCVIDEFDLDDEMNTNLRILLQAA